MHNNLVKALAGSVIAAAAATALIAPPAGAVKPAPALSATNTATIDNGACSTYGAHGVVSWSGAKVDHIGIELGQDNGSGSVGTVYGTAPTAVVSPAKQKGSVSYTFSGLDIPSGTDVAVVAKFFFGTTEYSTLAFIALGPCSGAPDLVITGMVHELGTTTWDVTVRNNGDADAVLDQTVGIQSYWANNGSTSPWPPLPSGSSPPSAGGDPACGTTFAPTFNTTLHPSQSTTIPMTCSTPGFSGDTWLVAMVDDTNVVAESNETNNVFAVNTT